MDAYNEEEVEVGFVIDTPGKAEWAISKIIEETTAADAYIEVCTAQIKKYNDAIETRRQKTIDRTASLRALLAVYMAHGAPVRKSKTRETLELPAGKVVRTYDTHKMAPDKDKLINALDGSDYVEYEPKLKWGEYKKTLAIVGDTVINTVTGEVEDGVDIEYVPEKIEVIANG